MDLSNRTGPPHPALDGDHVLRPRRLTLGMGFARDLFVQHYLGNAGAVAHIQKDQVAVVAPPVHPSHQNNVLAILLYAELSAHLRPLQIP